MFPTKLPKLPSKKTMAFFGSALTVLGGLKYDQYKQSLIAKDLIEKVEIFANEPLDTEQIPPRICLYILPSFDDTTTFRSEKYVKNFILPILNKSGLDVRIANADSKEELKEMIKSNLGLQPSRPPFDLKWHYKRHVGIGVEATALLADAQDEFKNEFDKQLQAYSIKYEEERKQSWIFTPKYEPPVYVEPRVDVLPLNVTKGFKQLHRTIFDLYTRSYEMEATGSQVVNLVKGLNSE